MYAKDAAAHALGMPVTAVGPGSATVTMTVRPDMLNGFGICQGGLVTTLADMAFAYACNSYNELTVASGFDVDLLAASHAGDVLTAFGRVVSQGSRMGLYDIEVTQPEGRARRGVPRPLVPHEGPSGRRLRPTGDTPHARQAPCPRRPRADRDARAATNSRPCSCSACRTRCGAPTRTCRTTARPSTRKGVHPSDLKSLADLRQFPFTDKQDLRANYPFGMFAVPREQVVRVHASSGTTGKPTVVGYTQNDIDTWADLMARSIRASGGRRGDIVHVAYGYGLFTGGLGAHYGAERLGCTVVPMSGGQTEKQVQLIVDFKPGHHHGDAELHAGDRRGVPPPGHGPARDVACRSASSAPNPGPRRCGATSSAAPTSTRSTSTACRK